MCAHLYIYIYRHPLGLVHHHISLYRKICRCKFYTEHYLYIQKKTIFSQFFYIFSCKKNPTENSNKSKKKRNQEKWMKRRKNFHMPYAPFLWFPTKWIILFPLFFTIVFPLPFHLRRLNKIVSYLLLTWEFYIYNNRMCVYAILMYQAKVASNRKLLVTTEKRSFFGLNARFLCNQHLTRRTNNQTIGHGNWYSHLLNVYRKRERGVFQIVQRTTDASL